ncbi:MAG: hypothetical protein M5U15_01195 [Kiritimatiellae bacterium]|nr:hypothetical protein [Kiritimatiellia bacterium]
MKYALQLFRGRPLAMVSLVIVLLYALIALYGEGVYRWHQWNDTTPCLSVARPR